MVGTASGARPTTYPIGREVLSSRVKPLGCKVEQSVPCPFHDIKKACINIFALHGGVLNSVKAQLYFYFFYFREFVKMDGCVPDTISQPNVVLLF